MKITLLISAFMLSVVGLLFISCDDKIEVQQAYDFSLTTMPVQKRIKQGETAAQVGQLSGNGVLYFLFPAGRERDFALG